MKTCTMAAGMACLALGLAAAEPVGWRGDGSGRYPAAHPPAAWAANSNVIWSAALPAWGNATPMIVGDRIFVGAEPTELICLGRKDGAILWRSTNSYFDALSPADVEKAKAMQAEAIAVRDEMRKLEQERDEKQKQLNATGAIRARVTDLRKKQELTANAEALAARVAELEKQAADAAQALAAKPNDGGLKKKGEALAAELKLLRDKGFLEGELDAARKDLATREPREAELKTAVETSKRQIDELRRNKLTPLQQYDLPATHGVNGYSTPTAVSDGNDVFVLRGLGIAACYTLEGRRKWIRCMAKSTHGWGHSASPVFVDDLFVVQMPVLTALNRETGETVWTAPDTPARWGSPLVVRVGGEALIVTPNGDFVRARDGKPLARRVATLEYNAPIAADGVVFFIQQGGKAVKLPTTLSAEFKPEVLWTASKIPGDRHYASPVLHDGLIYAMNQKGHLVVIDAKTGEPVYDRMLELGGTVYSSLVLAGNRLYAGSESGVAVVFETGREFKEVARNRLEGYRSCPVPDGDRLFIRTMSKLYCLGAPAP